MDNFKWQKDACTYRLEEGVNADEYISIDDGYSQWVLGLGANFNPSEEFRGDPDYRAADYRFVVDIPEPDGSGARIRPNLKDAVPDDALGQEDGTSKTSKRAGFTARLPIAKSSVLQNGASVKKPSKYQAPKAISPQVIAAFIDDSINPFNQNFLIKEGDKVTSRFEYFWHQDGESQRNSQVLFGREFTRKHIEDILQQNPNDEEAMLHEAKLKGYQSPVPSPLNLSISHGTFIADAAAGYDDQDPLAQNVRLIGVQLPILASQDTSGLSLVGSAVLAVAFIFERAAAMSSALSEPLPVVLNFSYGLLAGPRNGEGSLQRAIALQAKKYRAQMVSLGLCTANNQVPVQIVIPAGNSHLTSCHARSEIAARDKQDMAFATTLRLQPEDRTSNFVEFWFPQAAKKVQLTVGLPSGSSKHFKIKSNDFAKVLVDQRDGSVIARLKLDLFSGAENKEGQYRLTLCTAPTKILDVARTPAPAGKWSFFLQAKLPKNTQMTAWILRDESVSGFGRRGRQAYFEEDVYTNTLFDTLGDLKVFGENQSMIRRDGTTSSLIFIQDEPQENFNVHIAGGFDQTSGAGAVYSASSAPGEENIDVLMPTETSRALVGQLGSGTISGSRRVLNGTSIAAPQLARLLIEQLCASADAGGTWPHLGQVVQDAAAAAPRPTGEHHEMRTTQFIRKERTKNGLLILARLRHMEVPRKEYFEG